MVKEKKLNAKQKLALERIYRLFELANEILKSNHTDKEFYSKKYLKLAKKLGEKVNVSIPKELQKTYCKKCFSLNVEQKKESPFLVVKCSDCGFVKKFSLETNK